jgi:hypothetical protein
MYLIQMEGSFASLRMTSPNLCIEIVGRNTTWLLENLLICHPEEPR